MKHKRRIIHVDMDAFFAAVEQRDHPEYRGKPLVVGAGPHERGVVSTASYEARKFGIHSAMPSREAYRRCPHAIFVPGNHKLYHDVSHQVFEIFNRYTPLVEGLSCDEAFLDVSGSEKLFGDSIAIANRIRNDIKNELHLTASVGIAPNKFLAKIASDMNKPDGITIVPDTDDEIKAFLYPMPVGKIFGIGKTAVALLASAGIRTIGDVQDSHLITITRILGDTAGTQLMHLALGLDDRSVEIDREEKSISKEYTFAEDVSGRDEVLSVLMNLVSEVGNRIRNHGKYASTARIKLRWSNFKTITRQRGFKIPSCDDFTFRELALELFNEVELNDPIRLIGFGVTGLSTERETQSLLFDLQEDEQQKKREKVCSVIDEIRKHLDGGTISVGIGGTTSELQ